jgi:uncharacterized protein YlxW (UPF0749 family)
MLLGGYHRKDTMTRKSPTQVELERENDDLVKENSSLKKKLKRALKKLKQYEDIQVDVKMALDEEDEQRFESMLQPPPPPEDEEYFTFTLPNGVTKRIKKRVPPQ